MTRLYTDGSSGRRRLGRQVFEILGASSIAQAGGAAIMILGANLKSKELVRDGPAIRAALPLATPDGGGLVLYGTF